MNLLVSGLDLPRQVVKLLAVLQIESRVEYCVCARGELTVDNSIPRRAQDWPPEILPLRESSVFWTVIERISSTSTSSASPFAPILTTVRVV